MASWGACGTYIVLPGLKGLPCYAGLDLGDFSLIASRLCAQIIGGCPIAPLGRVNISHRASAHSNHIVAVHWPGRASCNSTARFAVRRGLHRGILLLFGGGHAFVLSNFAIASRGWRLQQENGSGGSRYRKLLGGSRPWRITTMASMISWRASGLASHFMHSNRRSELIIHPVSLLSSSPSQIVISRR
jgi:hypothetical protein